MEQVVAALYDPGSSPEIVQVAQKELQAAQKSDQGWSLAQALIASSDPNAQFLGAQTFLVQINGRFALPDVNEIKATLIASLRSSLERGSLPFVIRKLLVAITKVYWTAKEWEDCPFEVTEILGPQTSLIYEFFLILLEDAEAETRQLRERLVPRVSLLVHDLLESSQLQIPKSLECYAVWSATFFEQFKDLLPVLFTALSTFSRESEDGVVAIFQVLKDSYATHRREWPRSARQQLLRVFLEQANSYPAFPPPGFADDEVFLAFSSAMISICVENFADNQELHPYIAQLAAVPVPVVEDPLAMETLDYWNQFAEEVVSVELSGDYEEVFASVISGYWPRIKLYNGLRQADWQEFSSFRSDFKDFLGLAHMLLGSQLFDHLTIVVLESLSAEPIADWFSIESALFCLNGLADMVSREESQGVRRIFQSTLWDQLPQCDNVRVRQTAVNVIGSFVDFFESEEGGPYLAVTLTYLFQSLEHSPLQSSASRSVQKLCDHCRTQLQGEISAFLNVYSQIRNAIPGSPHARTVSAIGYVIQELPLGKEKVAAIDTMLELVLTMQTPEESLDAVHTRLRCIVALGKSLQELYPDKPTGFWTEDPAAVAVHEKIADVVRAYTADSDLTTIEIVCDILKAGMPEYEGPYVFHSDEIVEFLVTKSSLGPVSVLPTLFDLGKFFVSTQLASMRARKGTTLGASLIASLIQVVVGYGSSAVSSALDMATQLVMLTKRLDVSLLDISGGAEVVSSLALPGISSGDRFILRSAEAFWKEFLTKPIPDDLGLQLTRALLFQVSGEASRSDLRPLSDVVKALMWFQTLQSPKWMKELVVDEPLNKAIAKLDIAVRNRFVAQLVAVRGTRKTQDLVYHFWLKCRGIPDSYDPMTK